MAYEYVKIDSQVQVIETDTGRIVWRGMPLDTPVAEVVQIPNSDDGIALLEYFRQDPNRSFANLIRLRPDGSIAWKAQLPDTSGPDAYTSFSLDPSGLHAFSWSGFYVTLDLETGAITSREWTK